MHIPPPGCPWPIAHSYSLLTMQCLGSVRLSALVSAVCYLPSFRTLLLSTLLQFYPIHSTPLHATPIHSTPRHSYFLPFHSTPFHSTPLHSIPLHSTSLHSTPLLLPSTPLDSIPLLSTSLYSTLIYSTPLHYTPRLLSRPFPSCPVPADSQLAPSTPGGSISPRMTLPSLPCACHTLPLPVLPLLTAQPSETGVALISQTRDCTRLSSQPAPACNLVPIPTPSPSPSASPDPSLLPSCESVPFLGDMF